MMLLQANFFLLFSNAFAKPHGHHHKHHHKHKNVLEKHDERFPETHASTFLHPDEHDVNLFPHWDHSDPTGEALQKHSKQYNGFEEEDNSQYAPKKKQKQQVKLQPGIGLVNAAVIFICLSSVSILFSIKHFFHFLICLLCNTC